jgi:hypothetical protein
MAFPDKDVKKITDQVLEEFEEIESDFGLPVTDEAKRAIKFAVKSTLNKAIPF